METARRRNDRSGQKSSGLYVHYSLPKAVPAITSGKIRSWARGGHVEKLEHLVLEGQGRRLLGETSHEPRTRSFLKTVPRVMAKCDSLHEAVASGSLNRLQEELAIEPNHAKYALCKDAAGVGLLHKAVYYDYLDIAAWLVETYPATVHQRDSEGRTPLHYTAASRTPRQAAALLEGAGAVSGARDGAGRTPAHYRTPALRPRLLLPQPPPEQAKTDTTGAAGLGRISGMQVKQSHIRIWCHDCDLGRLQQVLWAGQGGRLLKEVSSQPLVKRFLEAVPYIMNTIRDTHAAVINKDIDTLKKLTEDPVPPALLSSRDQNNMTVLHKAAILGQEEMVRYIGERWPQGLNDVDDFGKTPLHYAAAVKEDKSTYEELISLGAEQGILDDKQKTAGYYLSRSSEVDKSAMKTLPDAPRTSSNSYPASWDWKMLSKENIGESNKKSRRRNKTTNDSASTGNTDTNGIGTKFGGVNASSTMESIKDLPADDREAQNEIEKPISKPLSPVIDPPIEESPFVPLTELNYTHGETEVENNTDVDIEKNVEDDDQKEPEEENLDEAEAEENPEQAEGEIRKNNPTEQPNEIDENDNETEKQNSEDEIDYNEAPVASLMKEGNDNETQEQHEPEEISPNEPQADNEEAKDEEEAQQLSKEGHKDANGGDTADVEENVDDDYDVQIRGENESEYDESNLRCTAEASEKTGAKRGTTSNGPNTQESLIEGVVHAEPEVDSQDASLETKDGSVQGDVMILENDEIDPEVTQLLNSSNMEMLAALVLNGEGARLVGRRARNSELQAFLDNVSTYMKKINKVHVAAREGNIRDLQAALDRRKFAIARDSISPNGATPLHVATLFGKTNIIKYLGGRFPETLSAVDFEGRTALHYAAVIPDNGHYYNLLQQLGANCKDLDDNGISAEEYREKDILSFGQLIEDFGIDEKTKNEMLVDKGTTVDTNGHMDIPIFKTEEGRYLAKSLGDPLIKGLTEVANVKPQDPIAYLAGFLQNFPAAEKPRIGTQESRTKPTNNQHLLEGGVEEDHRSQPIDVVTIDPATEPSPDAPEAAFSSETRDEHGQSMLHFAAARTHARNALLQLLQESDVSLAYRDELYRTARDVSIQANIPENTADIDRYVLQLAARGETEKVMELLLEGYEHILSVVDDEGVPITEVAERRGQDDMVKLLASIKPFEEAREALHTAIRSGDAASALKAVEAEGGRTLARGKNTFGRTALHVAVLAQNEDIVAHLAHTAPELLRIGDNLERTPLHYAMGLEKMEALSRTLARSGAKRVLKDLKGRQPSYYFMNKSDILRLKEEEQVN